MMVLSVVRWEQQCSTQWDKGREDSDEASRVSADEQTRRREQCCTNSRFLALQIDMRVTYCATVENGEEVFAFSHVVLCRHWT